MYTPDPENYENDVNSLLVKVVKAVFVFANENTEFYLFNISLGSAPSESKSVKAAEKYILTQYKILSELFADILKVHMNLSGKEDMLAFRFLSLLNAHIILWFGSMGDLSDATANSITTGYMHGIFS
ncbi:MAG: hypothetical protein FWE27_00385 [Defluviitaleaceae bacterium]|nr:hypothetical protein [Defluviitaleaceae bacterium]